MPNLFLILVIAFVVIVLAIACLATGWLFKEKTKTDKVVVEEEKNNHL